MGKLEKVVVLTVLFLVALILGVSLNAPEGVAKPDPTATATAADPSSDARAEGPAEDRPQAAEPAPKRKAPITRRETPPASGAQTSAVPALAAGDPGARPLAPSAELAQAELQRPAGPAGALSTGRPQAGLVAAAAPAAGAPAAVEPAADDGALKTLAGLAPSLSDEFMIYTWQAGDTFAGVAERYFGSRLHVNRLLRNNEGLEDRELGPGDQILVPVRAAEEAVAAQPGAGAATTYTVQSGDVLGTISMSVYGTSKSWRKIYDANRDLLADPNRLEVGMVLRIPE